MIDIKLASNAEIFAEKAESLRAFSGLKLLHVKNQVAHILGQIGKDGIFDEYTKHDISHIDSMLQSLDWIIPPDTREKLTPAEWLMLTLSIYFHDLGMLVTKDEFLERRKTTFLSFGKSVQSGELGASYKNKIESIPDTEKRDRFIYQEFVRKTHAERIRYWILNEQNPHFADNLQIAVEVKNLLPNVDSMFRRDLALVCESHHLSDLEDLDKYKTNQQYGTSNDERVNLHYVALILRTADLLHITSDRTPSIEFNLINPSDPISQEEWAKQMAVRAIRPKIKKNKEGLIDHSLEKDTLEVLAYFEDEKGFFGLISYLKYADKQLKANHRFNELAKRNGGTNYEYPWKSIDDSSIETRDFDRRQFEFVLDQTRILDLLVGHTLYNDYTVVLRELTQNAIDASKLKKYEIEKEKKSASYTPQIKISWDEKSRELAFLDNGTGMTLEIIQNHLLKVGSSRYQDETFKKSHPDFSPISRFGIGLLTCFLIADDIDIVTKSVESDKAILLKIRKIHGKYLLKYLTIDKLPSDIREHGTIIKLFVRPDVNLENIEEELKKWILLPNCNLTLSTNDKEVKIGYNSPGEVLRKYFKDIGYSVDDAQIKIKEVSTDGVVFAYALQYIEHWKEWTFMEYQAAESDEFVPIGTCIEGIRVDFNTPGFNGKCIFAIVNTTGKNAPRTNVARSNIEATPERNSLLKTIYKLYLQHISSELQSLRKHGFSITWAAQEANWLLNIFSKASRQSTVREQIKLEHTKSFEEALSDMPIILVEEQETRTLMSIHELKELKSFWTIDCASYTSADSLIKEIKSSNTSALSLLKLIFGSEDANTSHIDYLLCSQKRESFINKGIFESFQVDSIKIIPEQRRLDLRWSYNNSEKIWKEIKLIEDDRSSRSLSRCYIQLLDIDIEHSAGQIAIYSSSTLFILKNSELNKFLITASQRLADDNMEDQFAVSKLVGIINNLFHFKTLDKTRVEEIIQSMLERNNRSLDKLVWSRIDKDEFISTVLKTDFLKYDTTIWTRKYFFDFY